MNLNNFVFNGRKIIGAALNSHVLLAILKAKIDQNPVIFSKPSTAYITQGEDIVIPKGFTVNEEIELGVVIGKKCKHVDINSAMDYVGGYCVALDMSATSELSVARSTGRPWFIGKGFDTACPVSTFIPKEKVYDPHDLHLWCTVNGKLRQEGHTSDLIFNVSHLISYITRYVTLEPNDLILTGSPPGMGPVVDGDIIEGGIKNLVSFKFNVRSEN